MNDGNDSGTGRTSVDPLTREVRALRTEVEKQKRHAHLDPVRQRATVGSAGGLARLALQTPVGYFADGHPSPEWDAYGGGSPSPPAGFSMGTIDHAGDCVVPNHDMVVTASAYVYVAATGAFARMNLETVIDYDGEYAYADATCDREASYVNNAAAAVTWFCPAGGKVTVRLIGVGGGAWGSANQLICDLFVQALTA